MAALHDGAGRRRECVVSEASSQGSSCPDFHMGWYAHRSGLRIGGLLLAVSELRDHQRAPGRRLTTAWCRRARWSVRATPFGNTLPPLVTAPVYAAADLQQPYVRRPTVKNSPPSCPSERIQPSCASQPSGRQLSDARANNSSGSSPRTALG